MARIRRFHIGSELLQDDIVGFRVWSPVRETVEVAILGKVHNEIHAMNAEGNGYYSVQVRGVLPGTKYGFRLDGEDRIYPDPASRYQPEGPHGPSEVVDPNHFTWSDKYWPGITIARQVIYELHIGTFTQEGTWRAAAEELPELANCGITCIEMMPVAEFPGQFGWGYDGVNLFAPTRLYGHPDDLRYFINEAHSLGIGVILDVVYNHLGPDGNYLTTFSPAYLSTENITEWGETINYDGHDSKHIRDYFLANAAYWISEFHFDGLRLDATQNIHDAASSEQHILTQIGQRARTAAGRRSIIIVTENESQDSKLARPIDRGGQGLDAIWNDDFHHAAIVATTGHNEAYYTDYKGEPQEFVSMAKYGFLYQGQWYSWQSKARGTPSLDLTPSSFIVYLENHDQVANSGLGLRLHQLTSPGRYRAMTVFLLLSPNVPMLFQGQEFASSAPFQYFADHNPKLSKLVHAGRVKFLSQFPHLTDADAIAAIPNSGERATSQQCKLNFEERRRNHKVYSLTKDLLAIRHTDPAFDSTKRIKVDGAVLGSQSLVIRYFRHDEMDRLIILNLGQSQHMGLITEPLLAPPAGHKWELSLSTEYVKYGGNGQAPIDINIGGWIIPAESSLVFIATPRGSET